MKKNRRTAEQIKIDNETGLRVCSDCGSLKDIESFKNGNQNRSICRPCYNKQRRDARANKTIEQVVVETNETKRSFIYEIIDWFKYGKAK